MARPIGVDFEADYVRRYLGDQFNLENNRGLAALPAQEVIFAVGNAVVGEDNAFTPKTDAVSLAEMRSRRMTEQPPLPAIMRANQTAYNWAVRGLLGGKHGSFLDSKLVARVRDRRHSVDPASSQRQFEHILGEAYMRQVAELEPSPILLPQDPQDRAPEERRTRLVQVSPISAVGLPPTPGERLKT